MVTGWTMKGSEFESRWGQKFSLLHVVRTGSGAPINLLSNGYRRALSPEVKRLGREADHSPQTSAEVTKMWVYTSDSQYVFIT
jgi:hypothetical protein